MPGPDPRPVYSVAFSRRGDRLLTGCDDGQARLFAVPPGSSAEPLVPPLRHLTFDHRGVRLGQAPLFIDGDRSIVTMTATLEATRWDAGTGARGTSLTFPDLLFLEPSRDGRFVLAGARVFAEDFAGQLWETLGDLPRSPPLRHRAPIEAGAIRPDGLRLLTVSADRTVRLWQVPASTGHVRTPRNQVDSLLLATLDHPLGATAAAYSPSGRLIATAGGRLLRVWAIEEEAAREGRWKLPGRLLGLNVERAQMLVSETDRALARVHELGSGGPAGPWLDAGGLLVGGACSPDGRRVATLSAGTKDIVEWLSDSYRSGRHPGMVRFWDWRSGREVLAPIPTSSEPLDAAWSPDGKLLVVACAADEVLFIDATNGSARSVKVEGGATNSTGQVELSPGGKSFATWGYSSTVHVWDFETGKPRLTLRHEGSNSYAVAFSPDERLLAAATSRNRVTVWDLAAGEPAAPVLTQPDLVNGLDFSPDGSLLLTACLDLNARMWNWREGRQVCPPLASPEGLEATRFSPDGRWVITSQSRRAYVDEGLVSFWEWRTGRPVAAMAGNGSRIDFDAAGNHFLLSNAGTGFIRSYSIAEMGPPRGRECAPETLALLGEVVAGLDVREGGSAVVLTAGEWLERWRSLRASRPDLLPLDLSAAATREWHRRLAEACESDLEWEAAAWHLERLAALAEKVGPRLEGLQEFVRTWHWAPRTEAWEGLDAFVFPDSDDARRRAIEASALATTKVTSRGPSIDFTARFPGRTKSAAGYVARRIVADEARKVQIRAGSDDAIRIWVNDSLVLARIVFRGAEPDQEEAETELRAGENVLLVEVSNGGGGWNLYLRLEDLAGRKLRLTDDDRLVPLGGE